MKKLSAAEIAKSQLAASLGVNKTDTPRPEAPKKKETSKAPKKGGYKPSLYTLYPEDLFKIQGIIKFMTANNRKANASHAVRLALRSCALTDDLLSYDDEINAQDGRKKAS